VYRSLRLKIALIGIVMLTLDATATHIAMLGAVRRTGGFR